MKLVITYDEIFFDRYNMNETDKRNHALYIIEKALEEREINYTIDGNILITDDTDFEKEISFTKIAEILKREFFIFLNKEEPKITESKSDALTGAESYIRKNYVNIALSMENVCEELNITRKQLDNMFLKKHALTAKEYLKRLRVEKAKELVEQGESMETAASYCGFGGVKTMYRAFKDVLGCTPGECRNGYLTEKS